MVIGLSTGSDDDDVEVIGGVDPRLIAVQENDSDESSLTDLVEQPAKVMRIGTMIKQLLEEVRAAPLDEASRNRLRDIHATSIRELEDGLAPELREELDRLTLPFNEDAVPSDAELRIAQAQLVGWLEGLFHGIQTALFAQQMAARAAATNAPGCAAARGRQVGPARPRHRTIPVSRVGSAPSPYPDAQRVGGVPYLRRQVTFAEEGGPG